MPRPVRAGLLVFLMAYALFGFTTQPLTGYEPETAAVTEGLVLHGRFWNDEPTPPLAAQIPGKGGHYYARAGLLQPLLEAPFFAVGHLADQTVGHFSAFPNAYAFLWFYNPFVAALGALALFALIYQTRRSLRWATAIAFLYTVASIAWPYSKIGMETTFMFAILAAFALGAWARRSPSALSWGLTGFATGAAVATKAYALVALPSIVVLLWPAFAGLARREKVRLALAGVLPVLAWGVAIAFYNWARFGSVTDFGYSESPLTLSAPLNFFGLLFSPGKGLIFYSPLVVLGALGVPRMWKADRSLTASLLVLFVSLTCISSVSIYWGDEVWGPRYIVPASWALLVPIAWWAVTITRQQGRRGDRRAGDARPGRRRLGGVRPLPPVVRGLTGLPILPLPRRHRRPERADPLRGRPVRWIPELSPLLLQTEGLISSQVRRTARPARADDLLPALRGPRRQRQPLRPEDRGCRSTSGGPRPPATRGWPACSPWLILCVSAARRRGALPDLASAARWPWGTGAPCPAT